MSIFRSDKFLNTCRGLRNQKNRSFSSPGIACQAPLCLWLNSAPGCTCTPLLGHAAWHAGAALCGHIGSPSWGQRGTSHHFKSVPLDYFVDRLSYLVLQFLILCLRNREREGERERARAQALTQEEFPSASTAPLPLTEHSLTSRDWEFDTLVLGQSWSDHFNSPISLHPSLSLPCPWYGWTLCLGPS